MAICGRQAATEFAKVPKDLKSVKGTLDPVLATTPFMLPTLVRIELHVGLFMEEVSQFPEFDSYWEIYGPAQNT